MPHILLTQIEMSQKYKIIVEPVFVMPHILLTRIEMSQKYKIII